MREEELLENILRETGTQDINEIRIELYDAAKNCVGYEKTSSIFFLILGIVLLIAGIVIVVWMLKAGNKIFEDYEDGMDLRGILFWILGIVLIVIAVIMIPYQIVDIIKCNTFPQQVIYEKMTALYEDLKTSWQP